LASSPGVDPRGQGGNLPRLGGQTLTLGEPEGEAAMKKPKGDKESPGGKALKRIRAKQIKEFYVDLQPESRDQDYYKRLDGEHQHLANLEEGIYRIFQLPLIEHLLKIAALAPKLPNRSQEMPGIPAAQYALSWQLYRYIDKIALNDGYYSGYLQSLKGTEYDQFVYEINLLKEVMLNRDFDKLFDMVFKNSQLLLSDYVFRIISEFYYSARHWQRIKEGIPKKDLLDHSQIYLQLLTQEETERYLSKVSDFIHSLSQKGVLGRPKALPPKEILRGIMEKEAQEFKKQGSKAPKTDAKEKMAGEYGVTPEYLNNYLSPKSPK